MGRTGILILIMLALVYGAFQLTGKSREIEMPTLETVALETWVEAAADGFCFVVEDIDSGMTKFCVSGGVITSVETNSPGEFRGLLNLTSGYKF
jgi:hypothetical protein